MTAALVLLALVAAFTAGAVVESRRRPDPNPGLQAQLDQARAEVWDWHDRWEQSEARVQVAANGLIRWRRSALRWKALADSHADILAALGREVAEGGHLGPDPDHPSMRGRGDAG